MNWLKGIKEYNEALAQHQALYMEGSGVGGEFNFERLELGITGVNEVDYLKQLMKDNREENTEESKTRFIGDMDEFDPALYESVKFAQILHHESLHVVQSFNYLACNEHTYWLRNYRDLEFAVFVLGITYGKKWKSGENLIDESTCSWIEEKENWIIKDIQKHAALRRSISNHLIQSPPESLSTLDIIEGQAYVFQELTTDCIGKNLFHALDDSVYKRAYLTYLKYIDQAQAKSVRSGPLLFLFICQFALKFGTARQSNEKRLASSLFTHLSKSANELLSEINSVVDHESALSAQLWLDENSYTELLSTEEKGLFTRLLRLCNSLERITLNYFRGQVYSSDFLDGREDEFYTKAGLMHDRKMRVVHAHLKTKHKGFDSKYFLALLVAGNTSVLKDFAFTTGDVDVLDLEIKAPNGKMITVEQDNELFKILFDFHSLVKHGVSLCCGEHGVTAKNRVIYNCTYGDSLRMKLKSLFGAKNELRDIIIKKN